MHTHLTINDMTWNLEVVGGWLTGCPGFWSHAETWSVPETACEKGIWCVRLIAFWSSSLLAQVWSPSDVSVLVRSSVSIQGHTEWNVIINWMYLLIQHWTKLKKMEIFHYFYYLKYMLITSNTVCNKQMDLLSEITHRWSQKLLSDSNGERKKKKKKFFIIDIERYKHTAETQTILATGWLTGVLLRLVGSVARKGYPVEG